MTTTTLRGLALATTLLAVPAAAGAPPPRNTFLPNFGRSFYPGRSGQIMIVPREGHFITRDEPANAFMHGSPWGYDARVPMILWGPVHVRRGSFAVAARHQDIAPTIAAMLGLPVPATMTGRPLAMALRPAATPPRVVLLVVLDAFRA